MCKRCSKQLLSHGSIFRVVSDTPFLLSIEFSSLPNGALKGTSYVHGKIIPNLVDASRNRHFIRELTLCTILSTPPFDPFFDLQSKSTEFRPTNLGTTSYQPLRSSSDFTSQNWLLIDKFRVMVATSSPPWLEPISILLRRALSEIEISPAREIRFHRGNCRFSSADTHFIPPSDNIKGILLLPLRVSFGELFAASKFIVRVESNRRKAASFESSRAAAPIGKQVNITLQTFLSLGCAPKAIGRA